MAKQFQESIQFAIKLNACNIKGVKLLLPRNCEIKFKKELHSQWFLADLTIDVIRPSCYFSLKSCGKTHITSFWVLLCQWLKVKSFLALLEPDVLNTVNTKVNIVAGWKINTVYSCALPWGSNVHQSTKDSKHCC